MFDFLLAFVLILSLFAICAIGAVVGLLPVVRDVLKVLGDQPAPRSESSEQSDPAE